MADCANKVVKKPKPVHSRFNVGDETSQVDTANGRKTKEDSFKNLFGPKTYAKEDSVEAKKTKKTVTIKPLSGNLFYHLVSLEKGIISHYLIFSQPSYWRDSWNAT